MGGDLRGGLDGTVPPKFEVGERPMHPSPNIIRPTNILRSTVTCMECEEKYELTKKRCKGGIFLSEFEVFGQENGSHMLYIRFQTK